MAFFLPAILSISVGVDQSGDVAANLRDQMLDLDRKIALAQREGRESSTAVVPIPKPFRAESALAYLAMLNPADDEGEKLKEVFVAFQEDYLAVQRQTIPKLWQRAAERLNSEGDEAVRLRHEQYALLRQFDRQSRLLEASLISNWREILDEHNAFDAVLFEFVQSDRLRQRYSVWSRYALPEAGPDLFELAEQDVSFEDRPAPAAGTLHHYVAQRASLMERRFREKLRIRPKDAELVSKHVSQELSWDDLITQRSQLRRGMVSIDSQLERINRHTLVALRHELDEDSFEELQRAYGRRSYPNLLPDEADTDFREQVRDWLEAHADDPGMTDVVASLLAEYERWYDDRLSRLMRRVSRAKREFYLHLTFNVFEEDKREQAIADFEQERERRIERIMQLMDEFSEQAAR